MNNLFSRIRSSAAKRAAYSRLVVELSNLDMHILEDLNLAGLDLREFAHKAVYGR